MPDLLLKVTAFVTRSTGGKVELLLFRHPFAGYQLPSGTVGDGENLESAALREVSEETGLLQLQLVSYIGCLDEPFEPDVRFIIKPTRVYSRPHKTSFDWAEFKPGILVRQLRSDGDFTQVVYEEGDQFPDPNYTTYQIKGWVPSDVLATRLRRHFFHFSFFGKAPDSWSHSADNHLFEPLWAPLDQLPQLVTPQSNWLSFVRVELGYDFK
jgi:8-oxo-dGTP pyrophosphatase MutT (NUDIX family)